MSERFQVKTAIVAGIAVMAAVGGLYLWHGRPAPAPVDKRPAQGARLQATPGGQPAAALGNGTSADVVNYVNAANAAVPVFSAVFGFFTSGSEDAPEDDGTELYATEE
jgi:hypothetical protein